MIYINEPKIPELFLYIQRSQILEKRKIVVATCPSVSYYMSQDSQSSLSMQYLTYIGKGKSNDHEKLYRSSL
jgi:hypothetical protein